MSARIDDELPFYALSDGEGKMRTAGILRSSQLQDWFEVATIHEAATIHDVQEKVSDGGRAFRGKGGRGLLSDKGARGFSSRPTFQDRPSGQGQHCAALFGGGGVVFQAPRRDKSEFRRPFKAG